MSDEHLLLLHVDPERAEEIASPLRSRGWNVEMARNPEEVPERLNATRPTAAIVALDGADPGLAYRAGAVAADSGTGDTLFIFVGSDPDHLDRIRALIPSALFIKPDELDWVVKRLRSAV